MFQKNKTIAPIDAHSSYGIFDHTSLPPGVKNCYLARQQPIHIHRVSTLSPFVYNKDIVGPPDPVTGDATRILVITQLQFWNDNLHQLITIDGTHFDFTPRGSHYIKNFTTRFPRLKNKDAYVVCLWYTTAVIHCASCGISLPTWVSYRATTEFQGFSCGDSIHDDIPSQFNAKIMIKDQWLANALQYNTKPFTIPDLKGYNSIHNFAKQFHSECMHCPTV